MGLTASRNSVAYIIFQSQSVIISTIINKVTERPATLPWLLAHTKVDYLLLKVQLRCVCVKLLPKSNQLKPCREQVKKETNESQQRTFIIIQDQLYNKTKPMHENKQNMLHANIILKYAHCKFSCEIIVLLMNRLVKPLQN